MNFDLPADLADLQSRLMTFIAEEIDPITEGADPESPSPELRRESRPPLRPGRLLPARRA